MAGQSNITLPFFEDSSSSQEPPTAPTSLVDAGPFDCVKQLTHDHVKNGWREGFSATAERAYYFNVFTRESVWTLPNIPVQREQRRVVNSTNVDILAAAVNELTESSSQPKPADQAASVSGVKGKDTVKRVYAADPNEVENEKHAKRFKIGGERYAYVKRFKGSPYVNIREYYLNHQKTRLLAGKKGLNLTPEEWMMLAGQSSAITKALGMV